MAVNDRARQHFDNAVAFQDLAMQHLESDQLNHAMLFNGLATVSIKLAKFCVENHLLVSGIEPDDPMTQVSQSTQQPQAVWGAPVGQDG